MNFIDRVISDFMQYIFEPGVRFYAMHFTGAQ